MQTNQLSKPDFTDFQEFLEFKKFQEVSNLFKKVQQGMVEQAACQPQQFQSHPEKSKSKQKSGQNPSARQANKETRSGYKNDSQSPQKSFKAMRSGSKMNANRRGKQTRARAEGKENAGPQNHGRQKFSSSEYDRKNQSGAPIQLKQEHEELAKNEDSYNEELRKF